MNLITQKYNLDLFHMEVGCEFLSREKGLCLESNGRSGQKFCSLVTDKIVEGTLWALGSKPTSSYLLMLKNYVLIFIFILLPVPMLLGQYANSKTNCIHLHIVHIVDFIEVELKLNRVFYSFTYPVWLYNIFLHYY